MSNYSKAIKKLRQESGLTLLEVASKLGVKEATVQRYESGAIKNLKYDTIVKLAEIFHCDPIDIMGIDEKEVTDPYSSLSKEDKILTDQFIGLLTQLTDSEKKDVLKHMEFTLFRRKE